MSGVDVCVFIWLKKVMWSRSGKEGFGFGWRKEVLEGEVGVGVGC